MSDKIDWSKAPADATHYQPATHGVFECWLKPGHAVRVSRGEPDWREDDYADDLIATSAIKRPWSGEGLPPVGVVCEVTTNDGYNWKKTSILFADDCMILLESYELFRAADPDVYFRQIRTPEQIAADEREAAIEQMINDATNPMDDRMIFEKYPGDAFIRQIIGCLYNAGYRKT